MAISFGSCKCSGSLIRPGIVVEESPQLIATSILRISSAVLGQGISKRRGFFVNVAAGFCRFRPSRINATTGSKSVDGAASVLHLPSSEKVAVKKAGPTATSYNFEEVPSPNAVPVQRFDDMFLLVSLFLF